MFTNLTIQTDLASLVGQKLGHLTIIGVPFNLKMPVTRHGNKTLASIGWVTLECDCGTVIIRALKDVFVKKSGKLRDHHTRKPSCHICKQCNGIHHYRRLKLYKAWCAMKSRVKNPYKHAVYLEKGIQVCEKWINSYEEFAKWSRENGYFEQSKDIPFKDRLSLDRIDSDKDYCPENCRWTTVSENSKKVGSSNLGKKSFMRRKIQYLQSLLEENNIDWKNDDELMEQFQKDKAQTRKKNQVYNRKTNTVSDTL